MDKTGHPEEELFYEAVLSLKNPEECRLFFQDISTIKEFQAMVQRFWVAATTMLYQRPPAPALLPSAG